MCVTTTPVKYKLKIYYNMQIKAKIRSSKPYLRWQKKYLREKCINFHRVYCNMSFIEMETESWNP